ncbi:sphingomyelin phosphodiesterase 4, neutral membrane (neutral sphingomyelinase-3) [Rhizophlyctis rosea]|uniref:Sphingomyelin phosphodiesterase 4, neutral membrane (Neutral sphingomyelinase-3) n=1 Tax=Rhizophlyctis rosea TaxID=64517 RepID=A0AAD5X9N0_9FUNG|nr:sphingomyelin phosphodiesterase 4, neutral membrane (neutral sphingomyelinase-3) [Rhizophlyctis rosea]
MAVMQEGAPPKVTFNMFEYYILTFGHCAIQHLPSQYGLNTAYTTRRSSLFEMSGFSPRGQNTERLGSCYDNITGYTALLQEYLDYLLPPKLQNFASPSRSPKPEDKRTAKRMSVLMEDVMAFRSPNAIRNRKSLVPENYKKPAGISIFNDGTMDPTQARMTSLFVVDVLSELWLCQNDPAELADRDRRVPYRKATDLHLQCIKVLVRHIVSLDLSEIYGGRVGQVQRSNRLDDEVQAKRDCYASIRGNLYTFLNMAFSHWPREDSFNQIVDIWVTFLQPWRASNESFSENWIHFVQDNFAFYSILIRKFLERARNYALYSSNRYKSRSSRSSRGGDNNKDGLTAIQRVLEVFNDLYLLETLQSLERALFSLESYGKGGPIGSIGQQIAGGFRGIPNGRLPDEIRRNLANSGHETRLKIDQLEGRKTQLMPVFLTDIKVASDADTLTCVEMAKQLRENVRDTMGRLQDKVEPKQQSRRSSRVGPSSPRTPGTPGPAGTTPSPTEAVQAGSLRFPPASAEATWPQFLLWLAQCIYLVIYYTARRTISGIGWLMASGTPSDDSVAGQLSQQAVQKMKADIQSLDMVMARIQQIWDLDILKSSPLQAMPGAIPNVTMWDDWEVKEVAPGVRAADAVIASDGRPVLTNKGKDEFLRGVVMCDKFDLNIEKSPQWEKTIKSYENKYLVRLFLWIADLWEAKACAATGRFLFATPAGGPRVRVVSRPQPVGTTAHMGHGQGYRPPARH